jgi:uroporphyrinogen decarboxylase
MLATLFVDKPADFEAVQFAKAAAAAAVEIGLDSVLVSYYPVFRLQDSKVIDDIFGRTYQVCVDKRGFQVLPIYRGGLIKGPDDWKAWDKSDLLKLPAMCNRDMTQIRKEYGDKVFIFGMSSAGLFESTWEPMGFESFVVAARKEREFVDRMIRFHEDLHCNILEALFDAGVPGYVYSDDLAYKSGPMLNPKMFKRLFEEGFIRITETAHSLGMKVIIHSCGNTTSLLEWIADCGFDGVHPLEPTAGMELTEAKEAVGDRLCLVGNIDVSRIPVSAPREEVFETVRRAVADAGRGGGFILAADHSHEDVTVQNMKWMLEAGREYGRYPLEV